MRHLAARAIFVCLVRRLAAQYFAIEDDWVVARDRLVVADVKLVTSLNLCRLENLYEVLGVLARTTCGTALMRLTLRNLPADLLLGNE